MKTMELFAYFDPNVLALVFQCLAALVIGGMCTIKMWWSKATNLVGGLFGRKEKTVKTVESDEVASVPFNGEEERESKAA